MASYNSEAPVLDTYHAVVAAYSDFLTVAIHTILYERNIYPQASFIKARKYNYPVRQSRHPKVCRWIMDAVSAVEAEMLKCTIAQTSLIIHAPPPSSQLLERYIFSTASFPRIPASETLTTFASPTPETTNPNDSPGNPDPNSKAPAPAPPPENPPSEADKKRYNPPPTSDLPEQFRATLARLTTSLANLKALPEDCSFTLAIELRDEEDVDPPLGSQGGWIAAEPGLQRDRKGKGRDLGGVAEERDGGWRGGSRKGRDLGGVRTTPVRSLEAGAFRMEVWVEEGRRKFQAMVEEGEEKEDGEFE